jgi:hypothetical protein
MGTGWSWSCYGSSGGSSASCSAPLQLLGCAYNTDALGNALSVVSGNSISTTNGTGYRNTNPVSGGAYCFKSTSATSYFIPLKTSAEFQSFWNKLNTTGLSGLQRVF